MPRIQALLAVLRDLAAPAEGSSSSLPTWVVLLGFLVGTGTATAALIAALANKGKNKAESTKTIIDGLTTTLTGYNDALKTANERVQQANERADRLDTRLRDAEAREERLQQENERLERDSRDLRRQINEMRAEMAELWQRVRNCEETHGKWHPPDPPLPQVT